MKKYMVKESQYKPLENKIIGLELLEGNGPQEPRPPRGMPKWFKIWSETEFKPVINRLDVIDSRLDRLEKRVDGIEARLNKQDEFNKVVSEYMASHQ